MNEAELKHTILNKLMFVPSATYGELHAVTGNHDLFNYHLRELVNRGLVAKEKSTYSLTGQGRQQVALMEEDGKYQKQFKVGMFIDLFRKYKGKWQMYLYKRLKHPHYGYIGDITGKLKWGESLEDNLKRELQEELDIVPTKYDIAGMNRNLFRNETGEVVGDGVFISFYVTEWTGEPQSKNIEGEYFWHDIDDILNLEPIFREGLEFGIPKKLAYLEKTEKLIPFIVEQGADQLKY